MSDDPFRPPDSELRTSARKPLYSINGVLIATFCGSLAAGIILIYLNYVNLGHTKLAKLTVRWGVVGYMLIIALSSVIPPLPIYIVLVTIVQVGLAGIAVRSLQGAAIDYHREHSGVMHSLLRAAGLGVLTGIVMFFGLGLLVAALLTVTAAPSA